MSKVTLQKGRVQPVWAGHPWVFAQAVGRVDGAPAPGDAVDVVDPDDNFMGRGYWSPRSAIPVRIATRDPRDPLDGPSIGRAIERAAALRKKLGWPSEETTGYRLVHAEGDGLPGLVVDVLGDVATVQLLSIGMKRREADVFAHVARVTKAKTVIEVASPKAAEREGFEATTRVVRGPDPSAIVLRERGLDLEVEAEITQKTGFYFDQRDNRALVEALSNGARVLDLYSFVGAFGLFAARGGASSVLSIDSSAVAIATGSRLAHRLGFAGRVSYERADVRHRLAAFAKAKERFDLVVVDPPKLAPSVRHLDRARSAYRKLNADAVRLIEPGGMLVSCSCSAAMQSDDFVRTATMGARDAGKDLVLLHMGQQGMDHPTPAAFSEGRYLKCAFFQVR